MEPMIQGPVRRRPATAAEAKALAHPLRMRILRLCVDRSLTNKELAEWLGKDPGTVLHHVRTLVVNGFLVPDEVRQGAKGALEKPYRATGKSWTLSPSWPRPGPAPPPASTASPSPSARRRARSWSPGCWPSWTSSRPGPPTPTANPTACCSPCTAGRWDPVRTRAAAG
jgi:DNA-binding transcriptional ArsR family regulator